MELTEASLAEANLNDLVDRALNGEEIILTRDGKPTVRLTPVVADDAPRQGGQWRGRVRIAADFDQLPADIATAFGSDPARIVASHQS